ncbi:hypothetical protein LTR15_004430 [Elasticomyces elasticus]|nr:hypothetical protein LTR15_004430 [Elasticomyces elasticus]
MIILTYTSGQCSLRRRKSMLIFKYLMQKELRGPPYDLPKEPNRERSTSTSSSYYTNKDVNINRKRLTQPPPPYTTMAPRSSIDASLAPLVPTFDPKHPQRETDVLQAIIQKLGLQQHVEGGYFVETDRDQLRVPNPFDQQAGTRNASTTIFYLLTPKSPLGAFHRNKGRTVHTLHKGRGRYVLIHADEVAAASCPGGYTSDDELPESERWTGKARIETFIVGQNVLAGERLQWIVEGGKYKSSFLLPDEQGKEHSDGLMISETVVPGFEFEDHDFMRWERMQALVTEVQADEMEWMVRRE